MPAKTAQSDESCRSATERSSRKVRSTRELELAVPELCAQSPIAARFRRQSSRLPKAILSAAVPRLLGENREKLLHPSPARPRDKLGSGLRCGKLDCEPTT